jgi:hypothetical protein
MRRRIGSLALSVGLVLAGFVVMGLAAQIGWAAGGALGRRLAMAAVGATAFALALLLWMHLCRERRALSVLPWWAWTRRGRIRAAARRLSSAPSRVGVLDAMAVELPRRSARWRRLVLRPLAVECDEVAHDDDAAPSWATDPSGAV